MAKVKLTKTALKKERDSLKQFQRFLPTLQLKKQQLQLEMRECLNRIEFNERRERESKAKLSSWLALFGAEQDALYDAITCDPSWDAVQRQLQDDASGEHVETVPAGFTADTWHLFYAWQSASVLAMYRAWVADGKRIPVEEVAEMAAQLVCHGAEGLARPH